MPITLVFQAIVERPPDLVFDILSDLRRYGDWLPHSNVFKGTTAISDDPIRVGTTYVEISPWGIRCGVVTEASRPVRLAFKQPMSLRPRFLGGIDIRLDHAIDAAGSSTRITRTLELDLCGIARLLRRPILRSFAVENRRMLAALKIHAERLPAAGR